MAKAQRVSPPPSQDTIVLELTEKEAVLLRTILGTRINGGGPWAAAVDSVNEALNGAGVAPSGNVFEPGDFLRLKAV